MRRRTGSRQLIDIHWYQLTFVRSTANFAGMDKSETLDSSPFAATLLKQLKDKHLSQKLLAQRLGKDASTVSLWLRGQQRPRPEDQDTIRKLAKFLGRTSDEVIALIEEGRRDATAESAKVESTTSLDQFRDWLSSNNPDFFDCAVILDSG